MKLAKVHKRKDWRVELSNIHPDAKIGKSIIHSHVWIGNDVVIGDGCKIQAFAYIPPGVFIEDEVFIGPHVCFTNDKCPNLGRKWQIQKTVVRQGAVIGANATILPNLVIGKNSIIGAGAVVTRSVPNNETWAGNPARKI